MHNQETYQRYLQTPYWRQLRSLQLTDHPSCWCCGTRGNLDVHHQSYQNLGDEREWELKTLCRDCHQAVHDVAERRFGHFRSFEQRLHLALEFVRYNHPNNRRRSTTIVQWAENQRQVTKIASTPPGFTLRWFSYLLSEVWHSLID